MRYNIHVEDALKSPPSARLNLFKIYILPTLTYAGSAWTPFLSKSSWKRIKSVRTQLSEEFSTARYNGSNNNPVLNLKTFIGLVLSQFGFSIQPSTGFS